MIFMTTIEILRLSHRLPRDERISTHVALVARAFGASSIYYTGQHDSGLESSVLRIAENWGSIKGKNKFEIKYEKSAISFLKKRKKDGWCIIHLTMYGLSLNRVLNDVKTRDRIVIVVGSEQVPREIYELADFNLSITNQPHSEVAALAITLDRLADGGEFTLDFAGKLKIIPSERGKKVVKSELS
jgi:tRNA (cytidine56-2'-O)-methyltransferase